MDNNKIKVEAMPTISVLMAAFNCEKYIVDSVESILNQTFSNFEFIITDDCSTDSTLSILKALANKDPRIRLQINSENLGLTKSLNRMIDISKGKFLARMDGDDISLPQRFEKQLEFMKTHPDFGFCGAINEFFEDSISQVGLETHGFVDHEEIKAGLLFRNVIPHSTVFIRKDLIDQYNIRYNEQFRVIQDYELWQRLAHLTKVAVIPEVLLLSRVTGGNITSKSQKQKGYRGQLLRQIYKNAIETLGVCPTKEDLYIHNLVVSNIINEDSEYLKKGEDWLKKLYQWNQTCRVYDDSIFRALLCRYWFFLCTRSTSLGIFTAMMFFRSEFYLFQEFTIKAKFTLLLKCIIRYKNKTLLSENGFYDGSN